MCGQYLPSFASEYSEFGFMCAAPLCSVFPSYSMQRIYLTPITAKTRHASHCHSRGIHGGEIHLTWFSSPTPEDISIWAAYPVLPRR